MKKKILTLIITLILCAPGLSVAQLSFIPVSADYTTYNMNDSLAYVEIYLSFFRNGLKYKIENDTLRANFETTLNIKHNNNTFLEQRHRLTNVIQDTSAVTPYDNFLDVFNISLPFRTFKVTLTLKDLNSGISGEYQLDASIPGPSDEFSLSEIQLSSNIKASEETTVYTKNGLSVIPHPRKTFDLLQPMLYYYVELNKLSYQPEVNNTYSINYYVINDQADTVKSGVLKTKNVAGERQAEIGGFNAISLQHGVYYLNLWAKDNASKVTSNVRKKFYVHKPTKSSQSQESETLSEVDTDFSAMDADALKLEFNKASYIAVQQETNIFSQLDSTHAMRKFLTSFWRKRDQGDGVPLGTTRRNYLTMCDAADARFSTPGRTGWKTDLGRVLIMYGNPDEIERYPNSTNAKPYIIWKYYQLDGGSDFIFVDRMGFGDYQLIHSTYYKEIQDPSWQSYIYETGGRGF